MSKSLVIIGYGGHASEVVAVAIASGVDFTGFVDSDISGKPESMLGFPLLGDDSFLKGKEDQYELHIAIGDNDVRQKIASKYSSFDFKTLTHPTAVVGPGVEIGDGTLITPGSILTSRIKIGNQVIVNTGTIISHDCRIGDFASLSPGTVLGGNVKVGSHAFFGCSVSCVPGVTVGEGAKIGIGSVVTKDIKPFTVAAGVPARVVRTLD